MACRCLLDHRPRGRRPLSNHRRTRALGSALSTIAGLGVSAMEGEGLGDPAIKVCLDCGDAYAIEHFRQRSGRSRLGWYNRSVCIYCRRRRDREIKRSLSGDAEHLQKRREYRDRRRAEGRPINAPSARASQRQWAWRHAERWLPLYDGQTVVVYAIVNTKAREYQRDNAERPWIGRTWAIRVPKPGMTPPPFSVPLCIVEDGIVRPHPSTPDGWRWTTRHVDRWNKRRRQNGTESNNENETNI